MRAVKHGYQDDDVLFHPQRGDRSEGTGARGPAFFGPSGAESDEGSGSFLVDEAQESSLSTSTIEARVRPFPINPGRSD